MIQSCGLGQNDLFRFPDESGLADSLAVSGLIYSFAMAWQAQPHQQADQPADRLPKAAAFCDQHYRLPIKVKKSPNT